MSSGQYSIAKAPKEQNWMKDNIPTLLQKGMPKVNPNAIRTDQYIGNLLVHTKYQYFGNNRPFVEAPPNFQIDATLKPRFSAHQLPVNPRLLQAYETALEEQKIRQSLGVNYTP